MWSNWAGDQRCEPAAVERPSGVGEAAGAVERAVAAGRGVRVAGSGHSFTAAVRTDGTLLSLDRMGAVLDADPSSGLVRVEAGIRLHALSRALAEHGLAMPTWAISTSSRSPEPSPPPLTAPARSCPTSPPRCARCVSSPPEGPWST